MHAQPIKIAILAMGGEGGGVLADWIVDLAEANGHIAQTTSVPGVAQRTGATIYYVELYPRALAEADGAQPVLALMPLPGDVDVVLASELMEAGRAVTRGLVTPDRTTLLTSTHRIYSMTEKTAMGDGRVDAQVLAEQVRAAAQRCIGFDMAQMADAQGSVISAVLFGGLSAAGVLPFTRAQFEATIERGGVGVAASLRAFEAAYRRAQDGEPAAATQEARRESAQEAQRPAQPAGALHPDIVRLLARVHTGFPPAVQAVIIEGLRRLVDYQDPAYAALYLDRLFGLYKAAPDEHHLLQECARHLALWMSYEDTIRVADLKVRASRFERVRGEVRVQTGQELAIHEFMHPRVEEICETLPVGLGRWLARPHAAHRLLQRWTRAGRVVQTSSLRGFLLLWGLSRLRRWRRGTLRYAIEQPRIEQWMDRVVRLATSRPELALEVVACQRLVKGYGDTHARGWASFQTLMQVVDQRGDSLTAAQLKRLCEAALADDQGTRLRAELEGLA